MYSLLFQADLFSEIEEEPVKLPITDIIQKVQKPSKSITKEKIILCYKGLIQTIDSVTSGKYSNFDAITTTNCCHAIAVFVRHLIQSLEKKELSIVKQHAIQKLFQLESVSSLELLNIYNDFFIPLPLLKLVQIYLLSYIADTNSNYGRSCVPQKLMELSSVSRKFCESFIKDLQKSYSKKVIQYQQDFLKNISQQDKINDIPVKLWGKYIQDSYLRSDKRGFAYASNLFSMQVCLFLLSKEKAKVALVSDLFFTEDQYKGRYVCLLEGDGKGDFHIIQNMEKEKLDDIVVVFSGCSYSSSLDFSSFVHQMSFWISSFSSLVLACDIFYPQFPFIKQDLNFNNSTISPKEKTVQDVLYRLSKIKGVSASDSQLFCLTHIYNSNIRSIIESQVSKKATASVPYCLIPKKLAD